MTPKTISSRDSSRRDFRFAKDFHSPTNPLIVQVLSSLFVLRVIMEAFQLLSRGGARFDKQRFKSDVQLFVVRNMHLTSCFHLISSYRRRQQEKLK